MITRYTLLALILMSSQLCSAQGRLDTVYIEAERIPLIESNSTKAISVIQGEALSEIPVTSLSDLLRLIPGVNLNSRGPYGIQSDIGMRGSTFGQVLVLLDGMRLTDPLTGHFSHALPIPLAEIERIEVLRGPASVAYGSDAVGGVIHIISKGMSLDQVRTELILDQAIGSNGSFRTDAAFSHNKEGVRLGIGLRSIQADGELLSNPAFDTAQALYGGRDYRNFFNMNIATVNLGVDLNDAWSIDTRGAYDKRDFKAKYWYTASPFDDSEEHTETSWLQARVQRKKEGMRTRLQAAYRHNKDRFVFNPAFSPNAHTTERIMLGLDHDQVLSGRTSVAIGGLWSERFILSTDRGDHADKNLAAYAMLSHTMFEALRIQAGLRMENDQNFGTELVPQAGLAYTRGKVVVRAEVGQSIRAADYTERFISAQIDNLSPGRNRGNQDLDVERALASSIGLSYAEKKTRITVDLFTREGKDLIDYVSTPSSAIDNASNLQDSASYFYTQNVSEVTTIGLEFGAGQTIFERDKAQLLLDLSYTYLATEMADGSLPTKYLANHPEHDVNAMLRYRDARSWATITMDYIQRDSERLEAIGGDIPSAYTLLAIEAGLSLNKNLSFYGRIDNALDTDYQEILGAQMPGRWLSLGFKLRA